MKSNINSRAALESMQLRLTDSIPLNQELKHRIIHDLKAALLSHSMMIEYISEQENQPKDNHASKKIAQLRDHEATLRVVVKQFLAAIKQNSEQRENH